MKNKNYAFADDARNAFNAARENKDNTNSGKGQFWQNAFGFFQNAAGALGKNNTPEPPAPAPEEKPKTGLIIGIVVALAVVGAVLYFTVIRK